MFEYLHCFPQTIPSYILSITEVTNGFSITFDLPNYTTRDTSLMEPYGVGELFKYITVDYGTYFGSVNDIGYPAIPQLTFELMVPNGSSNFQIATIDQTNQNIQINRRYLPTQEDYELQPTFQINSSYYSSNGDLYNFISQVSEPYIVFGQEGLSISIFPFTYNPQANSIQVLEHATFLVTFSGGAKSSKSLSFVQDSYLSKFFENYSNSQFKGTASYQGKYLMITAPAFESTLASFADYKRNHGYDVTVVNTNVTGTTSSAILNYILTLYNNSSTRPDFILLVGDHQHIPAADGNLSGEDLDNPITDLNYARLDGSDFFADVFLGRFSITSTNELQNLINKSIYMEQNIPLLSKRAKFLAGQEDNNWMENQFENAHDKVIDDTFEPEGYTCQKLYQPTTNQAVAALNDNPLYYIYSGHGSTTSMAGGSFTITSSTINSATNSVYPFVFSFACKTGNFAASTTCIGESWIREARGGVAYFGSSVSTMVNSDEAIEKKIFGDAFTDEDQISPIINLGMKRYWGRFWSWLNRGRTRRYMKAYNLLGDPSLNTHGVNCVYDIVFSENILFDGGTTITYQASHDIRNDAVYKIMNGADVTMLAGNSITLNPGFQVDPGGIFEASIESCENRILTKSSDLDVFNYLPTIDTNLDFQDSIDQENKKIEDSVSFSIYPNPTTSDFSVCYSLSDESFIKIELYNLFGLKLRTLINLNNQIDGDYIFNFSTNDLDKGTYLIVYTTNTLVSTKN